MQPTLFARAGNFVGLIVLCAIALGAFPAPRATAATLTVTNTSDSDAGSLRAQIAEAAAGDTIVFDSALSGQTITLTSDELTIPNNLTIDGSALASPIQISGGGAFRVFTVSSGTTVALTRLGIVEGNPTNGMGGGGIRNYGTLTLTACTLSACIVSRDTSTAGGGIYNQGTLNLTACTLSANSAPTGAGCGGGLFNAFGTAALTSCTFSDNSAVDAGDHIENYHGTVTLTACTLSGNATSREASIYNTGTLTLKSCIVARKTPSGSRPNFAGSEGTITSLGNNLSNNWGPVTQTTGDLTVTLAELMLGALADNGGPTKTCSLLPGSAAIGAGATTTATDQRGLTRVGAPDIGAFESQGFLLTATGGDNQSTPAGSTFATPLTMHVVANNPIEPVNGGRVAFIAPGSGASAALLPAVATIVDGEAGTTATANATGGSYAVTAETGAGSIDFTLTNTAPPGAPTGVFAVAGDRRALVSFTPPANNGGDTITSYTVTAYLNGVATGITATGTGSPLTLTGLTNGTAYTFVVTATNGLGTSASSTASAAVTPAPAVATTAVLRALPGPLATASTLTWRACFAAAPTSLTTADFALTSTDGGSATGTVSTVVADGTGKAFFVTATGVSGHGTLRLDVLDRGMAVAGFTRGQSYTRVPAVVPVSWGYNDRSQLGDATTTNRNRPVIIPAIGALAGKTVAAASVGDSFTLALCSDGTIAAWGKNDVGQLGTGTTSPSSATPVEVSTAGVLSGKTVVAIASGAESSLALCSDGTLVAWGGNSFGQLGNGSNSAYSATPGAVSTSGVLAGKTIVSIAAGTPTAFAVCSDGTVAAWGRGDLGQLGNGANINSNVPVAVSATGASALTGKTVVALAAGNGHAVAVCSDGSVAAWGWNYAGQLGNGATTNSNLPVAVTTAGTPLAGQQVVSVACGYSHSMALTRTGGVYGWGQKLWGSLGNGQTAITNPPVETPLAVATDLTGVLAGRTIVELTAGTGETLVRCTDGGLAAWGIDHVGQLGDNGTASEIVNWAGTDYLVSSRPLAVDAGMWSGLAGRFTYSAVSGPTGYHHLALASPLAATSVTMPAAGTYLPGTMLEFTVTFPQYVLVSLDGGVPRLALNIGGVTRYAYYPYGNGTTSTMRFRYYVQAADAAPAGISVTSTSIELNGATLADIAGYPVLLNLPAVGDTSGVIIPAPMVYSSWAAANFSAAELADPAISGRTADPDGTGLTNLLRYAFDLPARGPVAAPTTVVYDGAGNPATLSLPFTLRADGADLYYSVWASEDLATWTQKVSYTPYGKKETVAFAVPVPTGAKRFFLRLQVWAQP